MSHTWLMKNKKQGSYQDHTLLQHWHMLNGKKTEGCENGAKSILEAQQVELLQMERLPVSCELSSLATIWLVCDDSTNLCSVFDFVKFKFFLHHINLWFWFWSVRAKLWLSVVARGRQSFRFGNFPCLHLQLSPTTIISVYFCCHHSCYEWMIFHQWNALTAHQLSACVLDNLLMETWNLSSGSTVVS